MADTTSEERANLRTIDERDRFERQITRIYEILDGGAEAHEWSNLHDLGEEAIELASGLRNQLDARDAQGAVMVAALEYIAAHDELNQSDLDTIARVSLARGRLRAALDRARAGKENADG